MDEVLKFLPTVLPFWPILAVTLVFSVLGRVASRAVFTKDAYKTRKPCWLFWWGHKTLSLHPIVLGSLLGIVWRDPVPGLHGLAGSIGCFAGCGAASVFFYQAMKGLAKKQGLDISLPGLDDTSFPPPPKTPSECNK